MTSKVTLWSLLNHQRTMVYFSNTRSILKMKTLFSHFEINLGFWVCYRLLIKKPQEYVLKLFQRWSSEESTRKNTASQGCKRRSYFYFLKWSPWKSDRSGGNVTKKTLFDISKNGSYFLSIFMNNNTSRWTAAPNWQIAIIIFFRGRLNFQYDKHI